MSSLTPEQRRQRVIDERCSGLWARWYDSGRDDESRGWDAAGIGRVQLSREGVRDLAAHIYAEHGDDGGSTYA